MHRDMLESGGEAREPRRRGSARHSYWFLSLALVMVSVSKVNDPIRKHVRCRQNVE